MKKRFISLMLVMCMTVFTLTGCGEDANDPLAGKSKDELKEMYWSMNDMVNQKQAEYDSLNTMYQALSTEELPQDSISVVGDGTGRYSFNSADSKIIFPTSFQYPDSKAIATNGSISIVDKVTITPGTAWICKMNGSTLELEHTTGISATIKVSSIQNVYMGDLQQDVLSQWFTAVNQQNVIYKPIFFGDVERGSQATVATMIDQENAYMRCGMVGAGVYAITYVIVYRGEPDGVKEESINNLINSINISGQKISVAP